MRLRRVRNSDKALRRVADPAAVRPGEQRDDRDLLRERGVPEDAIEFVEAWAHRRGLFLAAEQVLVLLDALGSTPGGIAVRRALLGDQGRTLDQDAEAAECDRSNLHRAVRRIESRLTKSGFGQQRSHK